jgi:chromosome partitioning protein
MKKIAFHIQKGGVGKTSLSGNVAYCLSKEQKTILLDCDPQGNCSSWFLTEAPKVELSDVLKEGIEPDKAIIQVRDNLYVLPTFSIGSSLKTYAEVVLNDEPHIFEDLSDELAKHGFEYAIFDLSPGMSRLEKCILLAVDEVITPLTPEFFSLDGIETFNYELQKINKGFRKNIAHKKIVVNAMNRSFKRHILMNEQFQKLDYDLFTIAQDAKIAESQIHHSTIFEYAKDSKTIPEFERLAQAIKEG